jgi:RHS repeat-associated protein
MNTLGEYTVTKRDVLGRTTSIQIYSPAKSLVREKYFTYSTDHNSVTVTDGSGANAISHTTWTDTDGKAVLVIANPSSGVNEFTLNQYDLAENLVSVQHDTITGGVFTNWTTTSLTFDGLNRVIKKNDRDNAVTTYAYDSLNDLTNRIMPGSNLVWSAVYTNSGQLLKEWNQSGTSGTRTNTYAYFASGSPFAGLLQSKTDARGVICAYTYDDRYRVTTNAYTGSLPEQKLTTVFQYEPRNLVTSITETFATNGTGTNTSITRSFDSYGQLSTESVNGGTIYYSANQNWDAAGRRIVLGYGPNNYGFGWQADGNLTTASDATTGDATGSGTYGYNTAGLLNTRTVGNRVTSITSRDSEGRPLSITNTVNLLPELSETLAWSGDGLLASDTAWRADFGTDSHAYSYADQSRRLTQEQLNLNATTTWTSTFGYDNGVPAGPGVLTSAGNGSAQWNGLAGSFARVAASTNNIISYAAYGHVNGQSTLTAWLDGQPMAIWGIGTNAMQWRASLELASGNHQLLVAALHPSGMFTAWATNNFTNSLAYQATTDSYDAAGNITNRVWKNPSGAAERTQVLSWDARGRLHAVTERDAHTNGYNWTATYDGLNRRLATTSILVTNGVAFTSTPTTINSYFDPQVEFLELGVSYGNTTEWKLCGPDLNGLYGGMNGTGGFDAVSPYLNLFEPTISDFRGNILGVVTNSAAVSWNPSRPTGYGAVPDYRPAPLANGANIAQASAWRGRWSDITGYNQIGLRPYDPVAGRWLTFDSVANERDPNYFSFAGGDPINAFDADGRIAAQLYQYVASAVQNSLTTIGNTETLQDSSLMSGWVGNQSPIGQELQSATSDSLNYFQTQQQLANAQYQADYNFYGSSLMAYNAVFNPLVNFELSGWEIHTGVGMQPYNSGQTLNYQQSVDSYANFIGSGASALMTAIGIEQAGAGLYYGLMVPNQSAIPAGANLIGTGDSLTDAVQWITPQNGAFDVVVHGTENSFDVLHNGTWVVIDQRSLATYIQNNGWNGEPIRLISCSTGASSTGIAQDLANKLGVNVTAPDNTIWIHPSGALTIGPSATINNGSWNTFIPGGGN